VVESGVGAGEVAVGGLKHEDVPGGRGRVQSA
jgi:hypothetical protein